MLNCPNRGSFGTSLILGPVVCLFPWLSIFPSYFGQKSSCWPQRGPIATIARWLLAGMFEMRHRAYLPFVTIVEITAFRASPASNGNTHNEYQQTPLGKQGYKAIPNQVAVGEISCTSGLSPRRPTKRASECLLAATVLSIEECSRKLGVRCRNGLRR